MNPYRYLIVLLLFSLGIMPGVSRAAPQTGIYPVTDLGLIPLPRNVKAYTSKWNLPATVSITAKTDAEKNVALLLQRFLKHRGIQTTIISTGTAQMALSTKADDAQLGQEGYRLTVTGHDAHVTANAGPGLFYGLQTFEQLFNPAKTGDNVIHQVVITDWPRYRWRGILLDCSRHYFPVPVVEKFIRIAAHYKLNTFHWHLTDDQGWRIQIPQYPLLTKVGAWRGGTEVNGNRNNIDHKRYGGYYTDAQIRKVVAYAQQRYMTIVPEIDIPGHSTAALAAYPWLAPTKGPFQVGTLWGPSNVPLSPSDKTFKFLDTTFSELTSLFPGKYIHIGGDEVSAKAMKVWLHDPVAQKLIHDHQWAGAAQVYDYFIKRMTQFLAANGRRAVVWNATPPRSLPTDAVVECWTRGSSKIARAYAKKGHDVIAAEADKLYYNYYQGEKKYELKPTGTLLTLGETYRFNPSSILPSFLRHRLLGVEGCLWTEFVPTSQNLFYKLLPRELALAEICWTPLKQQQYASFVARTSSQYLWLRANDYNFRISPPSFQFSSNGSLAITRDLNHNALMVKTIHDSEMIHIREPVPDTIIHYTLDGSMPNAKSTPYNAPFDVKLTPGKPLIIRSVAVDLSGRASAPSKLILQSTRSP